VSLFYSEASISEHPPELGAIRNGANTPKILVGSLDGGMGKFLEEASSNAVYAQGHLLFLRDGTLMAQPFDTARLETSGEAIPLAEQVQSSLNTGSLAVISVSQTGLLTYRTDPSLSVSVVSVDLEGKTTATVQIGAYRSSGGLRLSPDGTRLATQERGGDGKVDIWIYELNRAARTRLTFDKAGDGDPVWSPDGKTIIYSSDRSGARRADIYRKSADGSGAEELLFADAAAKFSTSISPDGKFLLYENDTGDGQKTEIWLLPLTPEKPGSALKPLPIVQSPANAGRGRFSPDGRWIAFGSDESKRREVYVIPFTPGASVPAGKRQISTAGGSRPTWRPDGKAIFYLSEDKHVVMTEVLAKGQSLEVGASHTLFGPITPGARRLEALEVAPDGKHLFIFDSPKQISEPLTLIQNWTEGLKK
jgi:WD40 repeat protein